MSDLQKPQILKPFTRFCMTIGNLPSSYLVSLTYEEQLLWLCDYLQNTVIPTVNNNGECVTELQNLYLQLKNYVDNYFTNLDVQNEIDTKLDEMATDGTLDNIINQEIFSEINNNIAQNTSDISELNNNLTEIKKDYVVFIGDSYGAVTNSWIDKVAEKMNLTLNQTYFKIAQNGYGFARTNQQFLTLLQNNESNIPDKNKITKFIICGGLNDTNADSQLTIANAITTFCQYVNTNYPNAHIYIGCIGYNNGYANASLRASINNMVLPAYKMASISNNASYLDGVEYIMHYYGFYGEDGSHPSDFGQNYLTGGIFQALYNKFELCTTATDVTSPTGCHIETAIIQNKLHCRLYGNITSNVPVTTSTGNIQINIGKANNNYIRKVNNSSYFRASLLLNYGTNKDVKPCYVNIDDDGNLIVNFYNTNTNQVANLGFLDCQTEYELLNF